MQSRSFLAQTTALAAVTLVAAMTVAPEARALGPIDLEIGAKVGSGTNPLEPGPNPFGFGLGARAGVSLFDFYAGVTVVNYFGSSQDILTEGDAVSVSKHSLLYGLEAGYNLKLLGILTVRPQIGVGDLRLNTSGLLPTTGSATTSLEGRTNNLYLTPGLTVLVSLGLVFVGVDGNLLLLQWLEDPTTGKTSAETSFTVHGQVGIRI